MKPAFLELLFDVVDCAKVGIDSRDEIEDEVEEKFIASGLGLISGGGGGMGLWNIDVDIHDENKLDEVIDYCGSYLFL